MIHTYGQALWYLNILGTAGRFNYPLIQTSELTIASYCRTDHVIPHFGQKQLTHTTKSEKLPTHH